MADEPSVEQMAAEMVNEEAAGMARTIKEISGTPYGVNTLSDRHALWAWGYEDETVDVDALRQQGVPDAQIASMKYPLQSVLMGQAGTTTKEQHAYAAHMTDRWMRARDAGKLPGPPPRPKT